MKTKNLSSENETANSVNTVLATVACPKCANGFYKQWREGDKNGMVIRAKCKVCNYVWDLQKVSRYCG